MSMLPFFRSVVILLPGMYLVDILKYSNIRHLDAGDRQSGTPRALRDSRHFARHEVGLLDSLFRNHPRLPRLNLGRACPVACSTAPVVVVGAEVWCTRMCGIALAIILYHRPVSISTAEQQYRCIVNFATFLGEVSLCVSGVTNRHWIPGSLGCR